MGAIKNHISLKTQIAITEILRQVLVEAGDGLYRYTDDWTDKKVAERASSGTGEPITHGNVKHVRLEVFGNIARTPEPRPDAEALAELRATVEAQGRRITNLEAQIQWLTAKRPAATSDAVRRL